MLIPTLSPCFNGRYGGGGEADTENIIFLEIKVFLFSVFLYFVNKMDKRVQHEIFVLQTEP